MHTNAIDRRRLSLADVEKWAALSGGALLLLAGARRRSPMLALTAAPLLYRGVTGHWPALNGADGTKRALSGDRGVHIRESVRLEMPVAEVYQFWRRLDNLPRFMTHLEEVTEIGNGRSHWVAAGPAGVEVEWDAEIINEVDNQVIGWQSLPGSDITTAGSVNFEEIRGGRGTQVNVHLQYSAPIERPARASRRSSVRTRRRSSARISGTSSSCWKRAKSPKARFPKTGCLRTRIPRACRSLPCELCAGKVKGRFGSKRFRIPSSSIRATPSSR